jgi:drug/metabolite transporter superfamily protein YnfA
VRAVAVLLALTISGCAARLPANPDYTPLSNLSANVGVFSAAMGANILDRHPTSSAGAAWAAAGGVLLGAALVDAIFVEEELKRAAARESVELWYRMELLRRGPPDRPVPGPASPFHQPPPAPDPADLSPLRGDPRKP